MFVSEEGEAAVLGAYDECVELGGVGGFLAPDLVHYLALFTHTDINKLPLPLPSLAQPPLFTHPPSITIKININNTINNLLNLTHKIPDTLRLLRLTFLDIDPITRAGHHPPKGPAIAYKPDALQHVVYGEDALVLEDVYKG